jgi:diguanylate cyclase (GGDEF)-like protein/PAS domain S-box-containing protein
MTPPAHRPLALIADDDATMRLLLTRALEQAEFRVEQRADGNALVAAFAELHPDLVVLDVVMPGMDGFEACRALRAMPLGAHVPILMLTGLDDVASINQAYQAGATDFMAKPINWTVLGHRALYMLRATRAMAELAESQARLADAQRIARIGNWDWNHGSDAMHWSDEVYRIFGLAPGTTTPSAALMIQRIHPDDRARVETALRAAQAGIPPTGMEFRLASKSGGEIFVRAEGEVVRDQAGRLVRVRGTLQDVTEQRQAEERIRTLADFDALTGLPNQAVFDGQLQHALARSRRHRTSVATLRLDLDQFKRINDTLGHKAGDLALREVGARIAHAVRAEDVLVRGDPGEVSRCVSRFGGDRFTLMIADLDDIRDAAHVARRLLEVVSVPFTLESHELSLTASIGIAVAPLDGDDAETLLMNADAAMNHAKGEGRNHFKFYNRVMNASAHEKLALEAALRRALERDEIYLAYQPQVDVATGRIVGVEALARWSHPELGQVSPAKFIAVAEDTGLISPLSEWILGAACRQNKAWQQQGLPPVPVAVNISSPHFRQPGFVATVGDALAKGGLDPRYLELEITEGILIRDVPATLASLERLKAMGVLLSIDDFGTGYSSLSYLKRFPIDTLKIDQSFVRDLATSADDSAITTAIIGMAEGLRVRVVAEGVENVEQRDILREQGCRVMQGYLFSRPVDAQRIAAMLRATPRAGHEALRGVA